jgi:TolB protein
MTGQSDFDREMTAYLEARSTSRAPEGLLDSVLARVDTTRQQPGWLILARWLPGGVTSGVARMGKAVVLLAIIALLVALGIAIIVVAGSHRQLPAPFGLAKPGLIAFDLAGDIYVANPDGTGRTQLTSGPDADIRPTWSPDGTTIAYESELADLSSVVIVMGADGRHRITLADHLTETGDMVWSPDSRRVAFGARIVGSVDFHVYIAEADRPGAIQLGGQDVFGVEPSWSPDGMEIAFKRVYPCCGKPPDALWLIGADGSNPHQLSSRSGTRDALSNTTWSPDGRQLAFLADGIGGSYDVYVINSDGTGERNISNSPEEEYWASWSPDGARIAFPRMSGPRLIAGTFVVVDPDGSHPVLLTGPSVNSNTAVWSPDGSRLLGYVYNPNLGTNDAIAVFDPSGRAPPTTIPEINFNYASWQRLGP